jgi:hypothetical protein
VCILSGRELKVNRFSGKDQEVFPESREANSPRPASGLASDQNISGKLHRAARHKAFWANLLDSNNLDPVDVPDVTLDNNKLASDYAANLLAFGETHF